MPARPYRPSGKSEPRSVLMLLATSLVAGVLVGAVEGVLDFRWDTYGHLGISPGLVFPLLVGLAAGVAASWSVGAFRIRAPLVAAMAGLLGGLAGQATSSVAEYQACRAASPRESPTEFDDTLEDMTGSRGWVGYVQLAVEQSGIPVVKRVGASTRLKGAPGYALLVVELLLAAAIGAALARPRAKRPFCESCHRWYDRDEEIAEGDAARWKDVVAAVERGDAAGALACRGAPASPKARAALRLVSCSRCEDHEPLLRIVLGTRRRPVYESLVPAEVGRALRAEASRAPSEAQAGTASGRAGQRSLP